MLISTKGRYASRMLVDIAMHQGEDGYVSMKDVAARQQISKKYMEAFTAPLASAGILESAEEKPVAIGCWFRRMKSRSGEL